MNNDKCEKFTLKVYEGYRQMIVDCSKSVRAKLYECTSL